MKHIAAYALLVLGGKAEPTQEEVEKLLKEAGVKADSNKVETLCAALKGKKFEELVQSGLKAMATCGTAPAAGAAAGAPADAAAPKEEPKKEEEEEVDADMGGLFGDDDY